MKHPLRLIPTQRAQREAAAWLIPGDDVAAWLDALAATGAALRELRLHIVPQSARDRRPRGVLVTSVNAGALKQPDARCEPYSLEAGRLYLPTHAKLSPAIDHDECRAMVHTSPSLFHPVAGLIAFEPGDVLRPIDLFTAPPPKPGAWDRAKPGVTLSPRLVSIMPVSVPTLREIEDDLRGDIGSKPLKDAPKQPDEPKDSLIDRAKRGVARGVFSAIDGVMKWMAKQVGGDAANDAQRRGNPGGQGGAPGDAAGGFMERIAGFFNTDLGEAAGRQLRRVADWAQRRMQEIAAASDLLRNREIDRLLKMLERDPREALKFAIPLNGDHSGRGIAPPGNQLGERDTNFNLSGLGGGGPVDAWDIPYEKQQELSRRYREMAMKEARAGRHRGAAYIFANLLNDLHAAANVLEEGGHFREAAIIWRDRLSSPGLAARCLERGGLLNEAVALYAELAQWLDAARIYRRLEREEDARQCVLNEVKSLKTRLDFLGAAKLLETDIKDIDAAVNTLEEGCLHQTYRAACFEELLMLHGRHGRHREARGAVDTMAGDCGSPPQACMMTEVIARVRGSYPDRVAADHMRDVVLALASQYLAESTPEHAERLTRAVAALAPEDRLLPRDGQRFVKQRRAATVRQKPVVKPRSDQAVVEIGAGDLPVPARWICAASVGRCFYAVGRSMKMKGGDVLVRTDQEGTRFEKLSLRWFGGGEDHHDMSIHMGHHATDDVYLRYLDHRLRTDALPETSVAPRVAVITPPWIPNGTNAICTAMYGQVWIVESPAHDPGVTLSGYSREGKLIESMSLGVDELIANTEHWDDSFVDSRFHLHVRPQRILLGYGDRLHYPAASGAKGRPYTTFGQKITGIIGAAPFARSRFAVLHPMGANVIWTTETDDSSSGVAADLVEPVGAFTKQSGLLVLAGVGELRVFGTSKGRIEPVQTIRWDEPSRRNPVAVLPLDPNDNFSVLFETGHVAHYCVTPPVGARR